MSDLITRLRDPDYAGVLQHCRSSSVIHDLFHEAADEIERLSAALTTLREEMNADRHVISVDDWIAIADEALSQASGEAA